MPLKPIVDRKKNKQTSQDKQKELASYCLGSSPSPRDLPAERSRVYQRLVQKNFYQNLKHAYPITYQRFKGQAWDSMAKHFIQQWPHPSPYLWRMPYPFIDFVKEKGYSQKLQAPYLHDLLIFEWEEIEMTMMPDIPMPQGKGAFFSTPLLNPEHKVLDLNYPVYRPGDAIAEKGQYFITLHRHPVSKEVRFFEHSSFFLYLWERLKQQSMPMDTLIEQSCQELGILDPLTPFVYNGLRAWKKRGLLWAGGIIKYLNGG